MIDDHGQEMDELRLPYLPYSTRRWKARLFAAIDMAEG